MTKVVRKNRIETSEPAGTRKMRCSSRGIFLIGFVVILTALTTYLLTVSVLKAEEPVSHTPNTVKKSSISPISIVDSLLAHPNLNNTGDIALLNLACAPSINGSDRSLVIQNLNDTLGHWALQVGENTQKNYHRYAENTSGFESEAEWRMAMMVTILGQDFKLRYDPSLTSFNQQNAASDKFFAQSDSVFITGCLSDARIGTCASLPVLYVAIGRRLGYPMHLVMAKNHLFCRWDDGNGTRINLEAANAGGYSSHPDDHYRKWPFPIEPSEEKSGNYLCNLTSQEVLAIFLSVRASCLKATNQRNDAIIAAAAAHKLAPTLGGINASLVEAIKGNKNSTFDEMEEILRMQQMARQRAYEDALVPPPNLNMPSLYANPHMAPYPNQSVVPPPVIPPPIQPFSY